MKKVLFCMLTLLFTSSLFIQSSFGTHWFSHKYIRGYPTEVNDVAWVNTSEFIIGGKDWDDRKGWLRKITVNGTVVWSRVATSGSGAVRTIAVPTTDPFYVVCGTYDVGYDKSHRLLTYYTSNGSSRNLVDSWHDGGPTVISNDKRSRWGTHYFAVGYSDNVIHLWDLWNRSSPRRINRITSGSWGIYAIDWAWNLLVADGDTNVDKRDPGDDLDITRVYRGHTTIVWAVTRCGDYVIAGDTDGYIRIYDYYDGDLTQSVKATNGVINDIDAGPGRNLLAVSSTASLRIWEFDVNSGRATRIKHTFLSENNNHRPNVAKFSPNGYHLAAGTDYGTYIFKTNESPAAPAKTDEPETTLVETSLLSNFPNPFNPETWIPYQLAQPAEVTVSIHTADGKLVRTLELGQLPAGTYQDKDRAAYWDGKNEQGESVASGVYFYTLKAGDFSATKKMLIQK